MFSKLNSEADNKGRRPRLRRCRQVNSPQEPTTSSSSRPHKKLMMVKATKEEHGYNGWFCCSRDQSVGSAEMERNDCTGKAKFDVSVKLSDFQKFVREKRLAKKKDGMTVESVLMKMHQVSVLV